MPFARPSLSDLITRAESDYQSRLGIGPLLKRSFLAVIARVGAGAAHGMYGYLDHIARQVMPDTADTDELERWASTFGIQRSAATYATGAVTVSGTNGAFIAVGTLLQRGDGVQYTVRQGGFIAAGKAILQATAVIAGEGGNIPAGTTLTLVSAQAGVSSSILAGTLAGGSEAETDSALRSRVLQRLRQAPHGGADFDYVAWARATAGVTRAWVYPSLYGLGTVGVSFVTDDAADGPIPDETLVQTVQAYIEARRPVTADVTVFAPAPAPMNPQVALSPNTPAVQQAVISELRDLLRRDARPGGVILLSRIREAVSVAAGETDNAVTSPVSDVQAAAGALPTLGEVTFL